MTKINFAIALLIIILAFTACEKVNLGDCLMSAGKITTETRPLKEFNTLKLYDNVNLVLSQGTQNSCMVETGENLMNHITTTVDGLGNLEIRNTSTCNWMRSYGQPLTVYLQVTTLDTLEYRSIGDVSTTDTLFMDALVVSLFEGAGSVSLLIHSNLVKAALHYGTQELLIAGRSGLCYVYSASFGLVDTRELYASMLYVSNKSSNDVYVRAVKELGATVEALGNIYYFGNPSVVNFSQQGAGELIHVTP